MNVNDFRKLLKNGIGKLEVRDISEKMKESLHGEASDEFLENEAKKQLLAGLSREALEKTWRKNTGPRYSVSADGTDALIGFGKHRGVNLSYIWKKDPAYFGWLRETFGKSADLSCKKLIDILDYIQFGMSGSK